MPTRWVGVDEAGYGPNLGPLVMTAVVAESPDDRPPDVWNDLSATIARSGASGDRLWVDDSKAIYRAGVGRDRLDAACHALVSAVMGIVPPTVAGLLDALGAGSLDDTELTLWLNGTDPPFPPAETRMRCEQATRLHPFDGAAWRIVAVRSEVVGPSRFNAGLDRLGSNKARVHFETFARLLGPVWSAAGAGVETQVRGDKHGGRHFYGPALAAAFPDAGIERGIEGPALSCYTLQASGRRLGLSILPHADRVDGLVALASLVSKAVRERWMDVFNAYWLARIPGLRPTAGYPTDSARFRRAIEPVCDALGLAPNLWWRNK